MIALLFFVLLFAGLAVAGIAGWSVDSRDSRFSLWPWNRVAPDDAPEPAARPSARQRQPPRLAITRVGRRACPRIATPRAVA
jgi:uncharacterized iron-regulated membrane protein